MADWQKVVRERLGRSASQEVVDELATHLEDVYLDALHSGKSKESAACQMALASLSDPKRLRRDIVRAQQGDDALSRIVRTVVGPGLAGWLMGQAAVPLLGGYDGFLPQRLSPMPAGAEIAYLLGLVVLPAAVAAYLSRRAGGTIAQRLLAAFFHWLLIPVLLVIIAIGWGIFRTGGNDVNDVLGTLRNARDTLGGFRFWGLLTLQFLGALPFLFAPGKRKRAMAG